MGRTGRLEVGATICVKRYACTATKQQRDAQNQRI